MHVRHIRVSEVDIQLSYTDARLGPFIDDRLAQYQTDETDQADFNVRLVPGAEAVATEGPVHNVRDLGEGRMLLERDGYLSAVLDTINGEGRALIGLDSWAVDSLVRLLLTAHLPQVGGTLTHAAGGVFDGVGILFPGVSGAGKSTLLDHARPDTVLSDEIVGVALDGQGTYQLHATPFDRLKHKGRPASAPLNSVVFPDRTLPEGMHRLTRADALFRLLQTLVCYGSDVELDRQLLDTASGIASHVPCYALSFRLGQPVRDLLQDVRTT